MKTLFGGLIALAVAVGLAMLIREDPGYVMISIQGWTVESSVAVAGAVLLLTFLVFYWLVRLLTASWRLPRIVSRRRARRAERQALRRLAEGYVELAACRWQEAETVLMRKGGARRPSFMHYVLAARAAQKQGAVDRCRGYLSRARKVMRKGAVAAGLVEIEALIDHRRFDEAREILRDLEGRVAKDKGLLLMAQRLYEASGDWAALIQIIPRLRSAGLLTLEEKSALEARAYAGVFSRAVRDNDGDALLRIWSRAPKSVRRDPVIVESYVDHLMRLGFGDAAEAVIHKALQHFWDERLVHAYGIVESADSIRQLHRAEAWLKRHRHDPVLLLTLGRLCLRNEQWERARRYFEESFALRPYPETCRVLAHLLEVQGEERAALDYYRQGMLLSVAEEEGSADDVLPLLVDSSARGEAAEGRPALAEEQRSGLLLTARS